MPPRTSRPSRLKSSDVLSETVTPVAPQKSLWPVVFVLTMLLLVALSVAGYFYYQYRHSAEKADAKEIEDLAKEIGLMMLLPEGETPTLATVTDKEKLSEQPFFQKSENGDKVLIVFGVLILTVVTSTIFLRLGRYRIARPELL